MFFAFSLTNDDGSYIGVFSNLEELFEEAEAYIEFKGNKLQKGSVLYIGEVKYPNPTICIMDILEAISYEYYEEYGDIAEDYLNNITDEEFDDLDKRLNKEFKDWLIKTNHQPAFWSVVRIKKYVYNGKDWECVG